MKHLLCLLFALVAFSADASDITEMDQAVRAGDMEKVSSLVENGVSPSIIITEGKNKIWEHSPIILATKANHAEIVEFLIEKGADVNYVNVGSTTALKEAAISDNAALAALLIENDARVDFVDENGLPILFWAVSRQSEEVIPLLVQAGADPDKEHDSFEHGVITVRSYFESKGEPYSSTLELLN